MTLFRSPRTAVHLVTVLEEMPVQETADGIAQLHEARAARRGRGRQPAPAPRPRQRGPGGRPGRRAGPGRIGKELGSAGLDVDDELLDGLLGEAHDHAERRALEDTQRPLVADLGVPTYELPRLPGGVDLGGLYELAALLKAEGMA